MGAAIVALLVLASASWRGVRAGRQAEHLSARLAKLQSARAASTAAIQAAEPPDVIQALPPAPGVAQVMQTLQRAADKEGAHVTSLQADDHPPTATALGHLDLMLSIKASYPSIMAVIQQVLDRYPGTTLRQILVLPAAPVVAAPGAIGASAAQPMTESEAHVTLAFWRRPLGVEAVAPAVTDQPAPLSASGGVNTAASAQAAASLGAHVISTASTSSPGATALPPITGAPSAPNK